MSSSRDLMDSELNSAVVPWLRSRGFKGSLPHFRRIGEHGVDLLTFQHDKHGGGFVIEIACAPLEGITTYWGRVIAPEKVTAKYINFRERKRIKPREGGGTDSWFRYDGGNFEACAKQVLEALPHAETWWSSAHSKHE
jgi:hypothetical protein